MPQWEYRFLIGHQENTTMFRITAVNGQPVSNFGNLADNASPEGISDALGAEGWELVSMSVLPQPVFRRSPQMILAFKRERH